MTLDRLTTGLDIIEISAKRALEISSVQTDSRKCTAGSLFVAVEGNAVDGHKFIGNAVEKGASVILCQALPENLSADVVYIQTADSSKALGIAASNFFGNPSHGTPACHVTCATTSL